MHCYLGNWIERYVATCKCILDGRMNRTRCRRSVPVAEWRISFGPAKFGHILDYMGTRQCHAVLEVVLQCTDRTATLPLIYRSVQLDIRCFRNVNKPALRRCLVFRNTSGSETHLNGMVRVHLRNLI